MPAHLSLRRRALLAGGAGLLAGPAAAFTHPFANGERRLVAKNLEMGFEIMKGV